MEKEQAGKLVEKLANAAFVAGRYSFTPDNLLAINATKKCTELSEEIVNYLTRQAN